MLRDGIFGEGKAWTLRHGAWLAKQRFTEPAAQRTFKHYRTDLDMHVATVKLLDDELHAIAHHEPVEADEAYGGGCALGASEVPDLDRDGQLAELGDAAQDAGAREAARRARR
jgi:hypothetical protein